GGRVRLRAEVRGGDAVVAVTDTGRGIPPDKLKQIFEPFGQIERGLTRTRDGAGSGRAISRQRSLAMGGDLVASSIFGQGSTFTLTIPLAHVAAPAGQALGFRTSDRNTDRLELT